jgi:hypothetical protein
LHKQYWVRVKRKDKIGQRKGRRQKQTQRQNMNNIGEEQQQEQNWTRISTNNIDLKLEGKTNFSKKKGGTKNRHGKKTQTILGKSNDKGGIGCEFARTRFG